MIYISVIMCADFDEVIYTPVIKCALGRDLGVVMLVQIFVSKQRRDQLMDLDPGKQVWHWKIVINYCGQSGSWKGMSSGLVP